MFHKILCPVDFSPGSDHALQVATRMAIAADAELVLFHAVPIPGDAVAMIVREQEQGLDRASRDAARLGAKRVSAKLVPGTAWEEIVRAVEGDTAFDLVVIGTHGRSAIARVLLGSVAEKVVRHAPCSVLAARPRGDVKAFEHVLCPVDFSERSREALELAAELVVPGGAGITLLHSIELPVVYSGEMVPPDLFADLDKHTSHLIEQLANDLRTKVRVPVNTLVDTGSPGARALDILESDPTYDLAIVGSHGRTGLRRVLLGSVAEKIVRHAPCPVLVARPRAA